MPMTKSAFDTLLASIQDAERAVREAGQREYAHHDDNALSNFEDGARELGLTPEQVLMVYAHKHWRGIEAWVAGHRSQREDVRGRIKDLRMYLALLWAIVEGLQPIKEDDIEGVTRVDTRALCVSGHDWIEVSTNEASELVYVCSRCPARMIKPRQLLKPLLGNREAL